MTSHDTGMGLGTMGGASIEVSPGRERKAAFCLINVRHTSGDVNISEELGIIFQARTTGLVSAECG